MTAYDAVVLAGGGARRLGGVDKMACRIGGRTLLDRSLDAVQDAGTIVVVGPPRTTSYRVRWVLEQPRGGGPVPALAAGLAAASAEVVVLLAADLPFLGPDTVRRIVAALAPPAAPAPAGAVLLDDDGVPQWLVSAWRTAELRPAVAAATGGALRSVMAALEPSFLGPAADLTRPPPWFDCDTPDDLRRAEAWAQTRRRSRSAEPDRLRNVLPAAEPRREEAVPSGHGGNCSAPRHGVC